MGLFKKVGKMAKKRLSFKHMIKMANPFYALNPVNHIKQTQNDLRDVKNLIK